MATRVRGENRVYAEPLSGRIADAIREAIVCGELRQGDAITQDVLAKQYEVSSMPVREALLLLSHEGMIDARPNRGFRVARMGKRDIKDIYWTHAVLAGRLTARASVRLSDADLLELEENNRKLAVALSGSDMEEVESLNWQFHRVINLTADSPRVLALLKSTAHQIPKHFYTMLGSWGRLSMHDHTELLEALRQRDASKSEKLAVDHVAAAGRLMVDYLSSQGYWNMEHDQKSVDSKTPNTRRTAGDPNERK